ncbi:MAG: pyridoxal phosphate-dependent aminotransferase [Rectinemataceae bacterium]
MQFSSRCDFSVQDNDLALARRDRMSSGLPVYDLSASNPTRVGLVHDPALLAAAFGEAANARYFPDPRGIPAARRAVADHVNARGGVIDPDRLYLCASTSEGYGWLFKLLCDPGDAVLVPRPGYPLFDHLAGLESVRTLGYPLEYVHPSGWRIDVEHIEAALRQPGGDRIRAVVLINPNNPTGSYVARAEREKIVGICAEHGIALIVDEVFFGFPLEPRADRASFLGESRVPCFVLDGLSKRLCLPQAKLGWIALSGPERGMEDAAARLDIIADAYLSAGTPVMNALPALFAAEAAIVAKVTERIHASMKAYRNALDWPGSPHRILRCEGGWTALVESPRYLPEEDIALRLLREEGLFVQPGYFFDMEHEPHFAFSLILEPEKAFEWAGMYRRFFDRLAAES